MSAATLAALEGRTPPDEGRNMMTTTTTLTGLATVTLPDGSTADIPAVLADGRIEITVPIQFSAADGEKRARYNALLPSGDYSDDGPTPERFRLPR